MPNSFVANALRRIYKDGKGRRTGIAHACYLKMLKSSIFMFIGSCRLSWRCWESPHSRCAVVGGVEVDADAGIGTVGSVVVVDNAVAAAAAADTVDAADAAAAVAGRIGCSRHHQGAAS